MASLNNVSREILESMRECVDRRVKLSIKRLVNYETRKEKLENRVLAFSTCRLYIFTPKTPTKVETSLHYLDIQSIESKRPNQLVITTDAKTFSFTTLEVDYTDEVNHMITHMGTSLKTIFPCYPLERMIKKIEVQPPDRLKVMYDLMKAIEQKGTGPCGGFTLMYSAMCDWHGLTYRDEVAWDVDTIYLSQDSRELCLRDFDHLKERDLVPIVAALVHNTWFTSLNASNIKLTGDVCHEILRVMKKNSVIESLYLSNTGISSDFVKRLSGMFMSGSQLHTLDLSNNPAIDDIGVEHLIGAFSSCGKQCTWLDLSNTRLTTKGLNKMAEAMNKHQHVFSCLQTLKLTNVVPNKSDDLQNVYMFLASPNMITHLDLSGTDIEIDKLMAPLQRGCSQNIVELKLSRVPFSKRSKEVTVQPSFKQFFSSVFALKLVDLSYVKMPADALKDLMLGLSANRNLADVHVMLCGMEISGTALHNLTSCLPSVRNLTRLDLTAVCRSPNTGLTEKELLQLLESISQNTSIQHLSLAQIFSSVKPKNLKTVMEKLVDVLQQDKSAIRSLSLGDSKLKDSMNMIINALGSNMSLTELDISGNQMGDLGARMLSKALQINNKLQTIFWDKNLTTAQGFEDIASALEKNYTLRKMPMPVYDASGALRSEPQRTEQALQTIERLLQRNHSPQKYSSDQAYRLQQGFLISSTQQMVDRLVVQSQDTINALTLDSQQPCPNDVEITRRFIKDADKTKTLLPQLQDIAGQSVKPGSRVGVKLTEVAKQLTGVIEQQMQATLNEMLEATGKQCKGVMKDQAFQKDVQKGCTERSVLPKDFTANILTGVDTEIFNKLSEMNLAVAAYMSDRVVDEVIMRLTHCHKTLTNHLNEKKKGGHVSISGNESPQLRKSNLLPVPPDSPKMLQRKSMLSRRVRPQSVVDRDQVLVALDEAHRLRPTTVPQTAGRSRSRSPDPSALSASPLTHRHPAKPTTNVSPKSSPKSTKTKAAPAVPKIAITGDLDPDPVYDNAPVRHPVPARRRHKHHKHDVLEKEDIPSAPVPSVKKEESLDVVPDLPTPTRLQHVTKDRPRAPRVRPTTRTSAIPTSRSADSLKLDEGVESFFSKANTPSAVTNGPKGDDSSNKSSTKTTPDNKKKGIFSFGVKDKDNKEKESKKQSGSGVLGGIFKKASPKPSPVGKAKHRVSDVKEEDEDSASLSRGSTPRSSTDRARESSRASLSSQKAGVDQKSRSSASLSSSGSPSPSVKSSNTSLKSNDSVTRDKDKDNTDETDSKRPDTENKDKDEKEGQKPEGDIKVPLTVPSLKVYNSSEKSSDREEQATAEETEQPLDKTTDKPDKTTDKPDKTTDKPDATTNKLDKTSDKPDKTTDKLDNTTDKLDKTTDKPDKTTDKPANKTTDEPADKPAVEEPANQLTDISSEKPTDESTQESTVQSIDKTLDKMDDQKQAESGEPADTEGGDAEEGVKAGKPRRPAAPAGLGFGVDILAQLKQKQEKRNSMAPKSSPVVGKKPVSPSEEKKPAFPKLKPVIKSNTDPGPDSPEISKKPSLREPDAKPAVVPRPSGLARPTPPMKPKPPPVGNKPTPAPRRSMNSEGDDEALSEPSKPDKVPTEKSGVVYDSATLKKSVRDKISMFHGSGSEASKGKSLSQSSKEERNSLPSAVAAKSSSLPRHSSPADLTRSGSTSSSLPLDARPEDFIAPQLTQAGEVKTEESTMTDSGIALEADLPGKTNGARSPNLNTDGKKSNSLTKNVPSDVKDVAGRPKSMFAVLESRPDLRKKAETSAAPASVPEETAPSDDSRPSSDEVILV